MAATDRGHRCNKSSITDDIAKEAFDDLDNTRKVCYGIYDELDAALEQGKLDVAKVLSKQLRTLADTMNHEVPV